MSHDVPTRTITVNFADTDLEIILDPYFGPISLGTNIYDAAMILSRMDWQIILYYTKFLLLYNHCIVLLFN